MHLDLILVAVGALGLAVAATSQEIRRLPVTEPLLALALGAVLGKHVTGLLALPTLVDDPVMLHDGARVLLAVSVMAIALRYPLSHLRRHVRPLAILLLLAMPAMALISGALGWLVLGVPVATAALLGAAVAPTDPVLASSVVTGEDAERDLPARDRQLLSIESGANDGLALPLVLLALAVAGAFSVEHALLDSAWQVLGAVLIGVPVGALGGAALRLAERRGATSGAPALLFTLLLALATLGVSGLAHVDGILAVFVAGLAFNAVSTGGDRADEVSIDEAVNTFGVLPLFVLLGAMIPWREWADLGWRGPALLAAILLLRRLPLLLALARPLGLRARDAAYLGWFGPVGVSALFYLTLEADRGSVPTVVLAAGSLVVAGSTVAHGLTAAPGRALFARAAGSGGQDEQRTAATDDASRG